jgi:hypothetical protein
MSGIGGSANDAEKRDYYALCELIGKENMEGLFPGRINGKFRQFREVWHYFIKCILDTK